MATIQKAVISTASLAVVFGLVMAPIALAETKTVAPQGEYAQIDMRVVHDTMQTLAKGTPADKQQAIQRITAHPEKYAPPVFYLLSQVLFQEGKKDGGAFWFYAGQLRARFDANRCADVSARQAVGVLNQQYGPPINQYMFQNIPKLEALIPKVVEWDQKTPHHYDHRWINLHGMDAMITSLAPKKQDAKPTALSLPQEQWNAIADTTRADYVRGFREAMLQRKKQQ